MAYETIDRLKTYMQKKIDAIVTGEKVTFNINAHQLLDEINEMESKAKAFDRIKDIHSDYSIGDAKCIEMIGDELERE